MSTASPPEPIPKSVGQLAAALGLPTWRVRRVIDELAGKDCPRIGPYRVIPAGLAERVRLELVRQGLLTGGPSDDAA